MLDAPIKRYHDGILRPFDLPGRVVDAPVVGLFDLLAVADFLPEQAVFVIDAVAEARQGERGQRIEKTGRQSTKTAVAQCSVRFDFIDRLQIDPDFAQGCRGNRRAVQG